MSSIDNEFERETAEGPAEHTLAEGSVGSDTETAKPLVSDDAGKYTNEISHHVRSNSIKKPTTFKAGVRDQKLPRQSRDSCKSQCEGQW